MQTVVLAAGEGSRMWPLTATRPKPMLPVAGQPLVSHTLEAAAAAGTSQFVLVVGYERDVIREYFGSAYAGVPIEYVVQSSQNGTADAVRAARPHLEDAPFVVLNGDGLYDREHLRQLYHSGPAVGAYRVDNPSAYGVLQTDLTGQFVEGVIEKPVDPSSNLINTGAYVFPREAQNWVDVNPSERGEYELTDVLAQTCHKYDVNAIRFDQWLDVGRPWELLAANEWKLADQTRDLNGKISPRAHLQGEVRVEDGATIREGVTIEGPVHVKAGATIGPNAYLRGATLIGKNASIGHAVEIKNSVIMADAHVNHLSYVGDSILGQAVNFGAGTTVANLRHDDHPVMHTVKGERISTGRRKFGIVAGAHAKTGINTSLNAGVTLAPDATTAPGEAVMNDH